MTPPTSFHRPTFPDVNTYVAHCRQSWAEGRSEWPPATVDELRAICAAYPEKRFRWLPSRDVLARIGCLDLLDDPPEPLEKADRKRLVAALASDREFRAVVSELVGVSA